MDIVEQLRDKWHNGIEMCYEAADVIEQNRIDLEEYRRENERLREALEKISAAYIPGVIGYGYTQVEWVTMHYNKLMEIARKALEDVV